MQLKVHIQNIGKIKKGAVSVRPFTVLAGPNNTGKSFFSKTLYSVLDTMNTNLILIRLQHNLSPLRKAVRFMQYTSHLRKQVNKKPSSEDNKQLQYSKKIKSITSNIRSLEKLFTKFSLDQNSPDLLSLMTDKEKIKPAIRQVIEDSQYMQSFLSDLKKEEHELLGIKQQDLIRKIKENTEDLKSFLEISPDKILESGFSTVLKRNLTSHFQVDQLHKLIKDSQKPAEIKIVRMNGYNQPDKQQSLNTDKNTICQATIKDESISSRISPAGWMEMQNRSHVVYLESPTHWKLRNALMRGIERRFWFFPGGKRSLLVPKYFSDLSAMLTDNFAGEMDFKNIFQNLTEKVLKGKMSVSESSSLQFKFKGEDKAHSLPMTASGVVQMGFLALLIEKKILDKETVLFMDEPETNLHPSWQVEIMKTLFQLAKEGAHIILATHSADMMKWLESHLKKNPEDKHLVAVNQMTVNQEDGSASVIDSDQKDLESQIKSVQENLIEPFLDLFLKEQGNDTQGDD